MHVRFVAALSAVALISALACRPAPVQADTTWAADPGHSLAEFSVVHLAITHVRGSILISQASVVTPSSTNVPSSIVATLDAASVYTRKPDRDKDLKGPDWLDVTNIHSCG